MGCPNRIYKQTVTCKFINLVAFLATCSIPFVLFLDSSIKGSYWLEPEKHFPCLVIRIHVKMVVSVAMFLSHSQVMVRGVKKVFQSLMGWLCPRTCFYGCMTSVTASLHVHWLIKMSS